MATTRGKSLKGSYEKMLKYLPLLRKYTSDTQVHVSMNNTKCTLDSF